MEEIYTCIYTCICVYMRGERREEKAENKKRPDVDKFHVTVLRRSFVCVKISYLGSLSLSKKNKNK